MWVLLFLRRFWQENRASEAAFLPRGVGDGRSSGQKHGHCGSDRFRENVGRGQNHSGPFNQPNEEWTATEGALTRAVEVSASLVVRTL